MDDVGLTPFGEVSHLGDPAQSRLGVGVDQGRAPELAVVGSEQTPADARATLTTREARAGDELETRLRHLVLLSTDTPWVGDY
jgi:hypothetical protein